MDHFPLALAGLSGAPDRLPRMGEQNTGLDGDDPDAAFGNPPMGLPGLGVRCGDLAPEQGHQLIMQSGLVAFYRQQVVSTGNENERVGVGSLRVERIGSNPATSRLDGLQRRENDDLVGLTPISDWTGATSWVWSTAPGSPRVSPRPPQVISRQPRLCASPA